eukprot:CAMPEP_0195516868 /NCGR_PEP_ID=MMETSP0794_2-20130614/8876_1 /TAXON_ID=515487 /ORGANISM="Stephanopyxis turris, Strain CCMP 815" /LENGTH=325 /DNA_ID=CAMNT_0040645571 /DNA_START=78 /DNA_END=1055 /DNA_ORIENTATION=-
MSDKDSVMPDMTKAGEILGKVIRPLQAVLTFIIPLLIKFSQKAYNTWIVLPHDFAQCIIGLIFCFFGGMYPTLFAAIQAAKAGGWLTMQKALGDLAGEAMVVIEANKKDNDVDADGDGKADVDQIDDKELLMRKVNLVLTKINPEKVDNALGELYKVSLSVIATLTVEFARTIALACSISEIVRKPLDKYITPLTKQVVPKEYHRWIPVVFGWCAKGIAMSIAWYIQTIISAFTSAVQGGIIITRSLIKICAKKGITLFGLIKSDNPDDTKLDELGAYGIAALGFYFQFTMGFSMPFPFNIVLMPFEMAESYIRWKITDTSGGIE